MSFNHACPDVPAPVTADSAIGAGDKIIGDPHGPVRIGAQVQILENTVLHLVPDNELVIADRLSVLRDNPVPRGFEPRGRSVRKILVIDDESKMRVLFWVETLVAAASAWPAV